MMNATLEISTCALFVSACVLLWLYLGVRKQCLEVSGQLVGAHTLLRKLRAPMPLTSAQARGVQRETLRQRKKHENHEMMRRGTFAKPKASSKKGRKKR